MRYSNIKNKLIFLSIVPMALGLILFFIFLSGVLDEKSDLELTKYYISKSNAISKIIHLMQIERGLSTGYTAKKTNKEDAKLLSINKELNSTLNDTINTLSKKKNHKNDYIINLLNQIKSDRKNINIKSITASQTIKYYTQKNKELLSFITTIPTLMDDRENRNFVQAYTHLSTSKEALGLIRAMIYKVFIQQKLLEDDYMLLKESLKVYHIEIDRFKNTIPIDFLNYFETNFNTLKTENTFKIIDYIVVNKNTTIFNVKADTWFDEITQTIERLRDIENTLFNNINIASDKKLEEIFYKLTLIALLFAFVTISLVLTIFIFTKKILISTDKLSQDYLYSQSLLEQYKSSVDKNFIVSKTDPKGIITYVNEEFCKASGYSKEELLGKPHNIIRHPDTDANIFKEMWHTIKDLKRPWFGEIKNLSKNQTEYWTKAIINPIFNANGQIIEYMGIRTDITEIENAKISAQNAEKAKSAFLATMSHELRTPLNAVIGFSQILIAKSDMSQDRVKEYVEKIYSSGRHLLNLVNNILDFSKIESGKMQINKKELLLEDLINEIILLVENEALKKEIKIKKQNLLNIKINVDEQLLKQVILNILSNAIKFTPKEKNIYIDYKNSDTFHTLSICDEGVGLLPEQLKTLFKPFVQIQEHQNKAIKGTGLGLVISQKIIELHNGNITVKSKKNLGSCFNINLPISKESK